MGLGEWLSLDRMPSCLGARVRGRPARTHGTRQMERYNRESDTRTDFRSAYYEIAVSSCF